MIGEQGSKRIIEHTQAYLTQLIRSAITTRLGDRQRDLPVDLLAYYAASSFLSLLTWWLDHDLPYSAEQMDTLYERLVFPGLREIFA